jgi:hypothetical protein
MKAINVAYTLMLFTLTAIYSVSAQSDQTRLIRNLTGDNIIINEDWSASTTDGSFRFETVRNGNPLMPRRSDHPGTGSAHSIAFEVPTDQSGHKERIEYKIAKASDPDGLHFDNARYSRFSFYLAAPSAPFLGSAIIYQCWQGFPFGPPVSLKVVESASAPYKLKLAIRNMSTGPDSVTPDFELWSSPIVQPNTWYDVILYIEPRYNADGRISLSINGVQRADWIGPIGYDPNQVTGAYNGLDIKNGIYQPGVNNGHTFYFDQIKLGTDLRSVLQ